MGAKLAKFFDEADRLGGLPAKIRLATLARMSSTQAESAADTLDALDRFERALATLRQESGAGAKGADLTGTHRALGTADGDPSGGTVALRKHVGLFLDLMSQRSLFLRDVGTTVARIVEAASAGVGVARASVWSIEGGGNAIRCADLFERSGSKHSSGILLGEKDFPAYFAALKTERTIAAHDAHTDPRTSCFSATYLTPLGISSMLDVPIWVNGKMVGVVCHEHVGPARRWTQDDENFAYLMSNFVALAHERAG